MDGELFFPASWFEEKAADKRKKVGFPEGQTFKTKPKLAWEIIQRLKVKEIPFQAVVMDELYGRDGELRKRLEEAEIEYYGDIPFNTVMYLERPQVVSPITKQGKPCKHYRVVAKHRYTTAELLKHPNLEWAEITPNVPSQLIQYFEKTEMVPDMSVTLAESIRDPSLPPPIIGVTSRHFLGDPFPFVGRGGSIASRRPPRGRQKG